MGVRYFLLAFVLTLVWKAGVHADEERQAPAFVGTYHLGAVASDNAEASQAGAQILKAGGTAADAAAATMLALGATSPGGSGLGGGGFALYFSAADESLTFLDFRERAPAGATADMYQNAPKGASRTGGLATGVPGEPAGIEEMHKRFGRLPIGDVVAPALRLATRGVKVTPHLSRQIDYFQESLRKDKSLRRWFARGKPKVGSKLRRPALAKVLRKMATMGMGVFYKGELAKTIASDVQAKGGIVHADDLAKYEVVERKPLVDEYFGVYWVTAPPPSAGGFTLLQSLAILERIYAPGRFDRVRYFHALAESWKGPFSDRQRYFGDPDHVSLPLAALMNPARILARSNLINFEKTTPEALYSMPIEEPNPNIKNPDNSGTSHLCVVDRFGNVAAITTTVNLPFGAGYTAGGVIMNDEMDDFATAVGEANAFGLVGGARNLPAPGKRPVSTMSPTIVFDHHGPVLCIGASGGSRIVTATEQVAIDVLVHKKSLGDAIAAPRVHHQGQPDLLRVEEFAPLDDVSVKRLERLGHKIKAIGSVANVQAIHIQRGNKPTLTAVSDPRKGGRPAGY